MNIKKIFFLLIIPANCLAGPYVELSLDYDPTPAQYSWHTADINIEKKASNYIGGVVVGWKWRSSGILTDEDALNIKLKLLSHRSDPLKNGSQDIVSENDIRGVSMEYVFW